MSSMWKRTVTFFFFFFKLPRQTQPGGLDAGSRVHICLGPNPGVVQDQRHTNTHSRHMVLNFWCVSVLASIQMEIVHHLGRDGLFFLFGNCNNYCPQTDGFMTHNETLRQRADAPCRLITLPLLHISGCSLIHQCIIPIIIITFVLNNDSVTVIDSGLLV